MGKGKSNGTVVEDGDAPSLAASHLDPDRRRNLASVSRSRSYSVHETRDEAATARAVKDAFEAGAASGRLHFEGVQRAYLDTLKMLTEANAKNAELVGRLQVVAGQNVTLTLLEGQARQSELDSRLHHETLRQVLPEAFRAIGPAAVPIAAWIGKKFNLLPPAPPKGDKSPRAVTVRVLTRLQDGSEESKAVLGVLEEFVGADDFPIVLGFLVESVAEPAPAAAKTADGEGSTGGAS